MAGSDNNSAVSDERAQPPQASPSEELESVAGRPKDAHSFKKHILLAKTNII